MTYKRICGLAAIAVIAPACDYFGPTSVDVRLRREAAGYVLSFQSCRGKPIAVHHVRVSRVGPGTTTTAEPHCEFDVPMSQPIRGAWRYGVPPANATSRKCLPLTPGSYSISVGGGEDGGYRRVRIDANGDVQSGEGSCDSR